MDRRALLHGLCDRHGLLAVYLFGSRADDGVAVLDGGTVPSGGSDLDVGVMVGPQATEPRTPRLTSLLVELEEIFAPLRVDLVPLQHLDPIFQYEALEGHRVATTDPLAADELELLVMRRAAELLPIERQLEEEMFGTSTA